MGSSPTLHAKVSTQERQMKTLRKFFKRLFASKKQYTMVALSPTFDFNRSRAMEAKMNSPLNIGASITRWEGTKTQEKQ